MTGKILTDKSTSAA